ncbi:hypothetical protein QBC38DRAFT_550696 [Podospora fimiseda]|uniref:Uncharacterized protein n=1 Tax=Podospora fimiseda TaxID=252190 RepID=A0AAN6YJT0_9PEZI|nr:hypothetical protein QBC38DRAFT_550696 [Podospora fimiseda]
MDAAMGKLMPHMPTETGITTDDNYTESEPEPEDYPIDIWDMSNCAGWWVTAEKWDERFERPGRPVAYGEDTPTDYIKAEPHPDDVPLATPCHGLHDSVAWSTTRCSLPDEATSPSCKYTRQDQKNQAEDRKKVKKRVAWSMGYPRWDLPYDVYGEYGTLEELANEYLGPNFRRQLEQQYLERHKMFYYTTRESGLESDAVRMASDYHIRQRAWEKHCSGPSDFTRVPRSGNGQRAFPGPIGTN